MTTNIQEENYTMIDSWGVSLNTIVYEEGIADLNAKIDAIVPVQYNNPTINNSVIDNINSYGANNSNIVQNSVVNNVNGDAYLAYQPKAEFDIANNIVSFFFDPVWSPNNSYKLSSFAFDGLGNLITKYYDGNNVLQTNTFSLTT